MVNLRNPPQWCKCRTCGKRYNSTKSTADLTGYCSQKCLIAKAKQHGWRKVRYPGHGGGRQRSYYDVLKDVGEIGYVEWIEPAVGRKLPAKSGNTVWVFTAECDDHGRQVIAVTDYDPEKVGVEHLWDLLEAYLATFINDDGDFVREYAESLTMRDLLDQYAASEFQVDKLPVLTLG